MKVGNGEIAFARIEKKRSACFLILIDNRWRDRPVFVQVHLKRGTAAKCLNIVEIILHQSRVVHREICRRIGVVERERSAAWNIVDVTTVAAVKTHHAKRSVIGQWKVQKAFQASTKLSFSEFIDLKIGSALKTGG